jgi:hypothetical protein
MKNSLCGKVLIFPRSRQSVSGAVAAFTADSHQRHISPCDVLQSTFKIQSWGKTRSYYLPSKLLYIVLGMGRVGKASYGLEGSEIKSRKRRDFSHPTRLALRPIQPHKQLVQSLLHPSRLPPYSPHLAQKVENKSQWDQIQVYYLHATQRPQPTGLPKRRRNTLRHNSKISRTPFEHQAELEGTHSQEAETDGCPLQGTSLVTWTVIPPVSQQ